MSLQDNLLGYWKLSDSTVINGTVGILDSSGNDRHGTATIDDGEKSVLDSKFGRCVEFNGGDFIDCGPAPILGNSAFSMQVWVNASSVSRYSGGIGVGASGSGNSSYLGTVSGGIGGGFFGSNHNTGNNTTDVWHQLILTFSGGPGGTMKIYLNNTVTNTTTFTPNINSGNILIGRIAPGTNYDFQGKIAEVALWDRELTEGEVSECWNEGNGKNLEPETLSKGTRGVKVLIVAGGGGGGGSTAGGGGAGGVIQDNDYSITTGTYDIIIGEGGSGSRKSDDGSVNNTSGGNTTFNGLIAIGGGYGYSGKPSGSRNAANGGSGGGAGGYSGNDIKPGVNGIGTPGQGYDGGIADGSMGNWGGAGGGGAGGPGADMTGTRAGGVGISSDISGTATYYGGGGGGGVTNSGESQGGLGGGGNGGDGQAYEAQPGQANTGGGGGGGGFYQTGPGGADGGSGIVIISYATNGTDGISNASTGGTKTTSGDQTIHTFTSNGTIELLPLSPTIELLVVAGGGSGGGSTAGGGGAGGLIYESKHIITGGEYSITVGDGGVIAPQMTLGNNGSNSIFDTLTAIGGGGGGFTSSGASFAGGSNGGSGGGGTQYGSKGGAPGLGTPEQGNDGGVKGIDLYPGGGGGGAGAVGQDGSGSKSGDGGIGLSYDISGTPTYYAGGGGGGSQAAGGAGGLGGGGAGTNNGTIGSNAITNTGGGGGGGWFYSGGQGGAGGSGIIIISYNADGSDGITNESTGGIITTSGSKRIHTFLTSGTMVFVLNQNSNIIGMSSMTGVSSITF